MSATRIVPRSPRSPTASAVSVNFPPRRGPVSPTSQSQTTCLAGCAGTQQNPPRQQRCEYWLPTIGSLRSITPTGHIHARSAGFPRSDDPGSTSPARATPATEKQSAATAGAWMATTRTRWVDLKPCTLTIAASANKSPTMGQSGLTDTPAAWVRPNLVAYTSASQSPAVSHQAELTDLRAGFGAPLLKGMSDDHLRNLRPYCPQGRRGI